MRIQMRVETASGGYRLWLTKSQHWLLVNAYSALTDQVREPVEVDLMLGAAGRRLGELLENVRFAETGSRVHLVLSREEAHSLHALLVCAPSTFSTEESFHSRVGAFRENLLDMAKEFASAVRETGRTA